MKPNALILAAGQGRRLLPLTAEIPKSLLTIGELPILHHQLRQLTELGVENVAIVVGHRGERIRSYISVHFPNREFHFIENPAHDRTNNLYSLAVAAEEMRDGPVLLMNGDTVMSPSVLRGLLEAANASMSVIRVASCDDEEMKVTTDERGRILTMNKRVRQGTLGEAIGIHYFSAPHWYELRSVLKRMRESHAQEYYESAIEQLLRLHPMYAHRIDAADAMEIDFPEDLERARTEFALRI